MLWPGKEQQVSKIEIFRDKAGQHRWRLRSSNNRIVAASEGYTRRRDAVRGAYAMLKAALRAAPRASRL